MLRRMEIDNLEPAHCKDLYKNVWAMFSISQVAENYQINPYRFLAFINRTSAHYNLHNNQFHNFRHGVTVMNAAYHILRTTQI